MSQAAHKIIAQDRDENKAHLCNVPGSIWARNWAELHSDYTPYVLEAHAFWNGVYMSAHYLDEEYLEIIRFLSEISDELRDMARTAENERRACSHG